MVSNPEDICAHIRTALEHSGLFANDDGSSQVWRVAPEPFVLSKEEYTFISALGKHLLRFYRGLNQLYQDSLKNKIPNWFAEYLDIGKPSGLLDLGRMNRFKSHLPGIIRPDLMVTENGFSITELDSIPGGFGNLTQLMSLYTQRGHNLPGMDVGGIPELFWKMIQTTSRKNNPVLAMIISKEADDYHAEMRFLISHLTEKGFSAHLIRPDQIVFSENGLFLESGLQIDVLYRFFELFDLKNIPKAELVMYAAKKGKVFVTPPYKPFLEEKLALALFHHPVLESYWEKELGSETFELLSHLIPNTWILDNRDLPPHGVIPDLKVGKAAIREWQQLYPLSQKEREMVVKVSGFSPLSWGSRGVTIGHDVSSEDWRKILEERISNFRQEPSVLQSFRKGKRIRTKYMDFGSGEIIEIECRARLTPYYFFTGETAELGGILATLCHKDKKKIHGMNDAVMIPCSVA